MNVMGNVFYSTEQDKTLLMPSISLFETKTILHNFLKSANETKTNWGNEWWYYTCKNTQMLS